MTGSGSSSTSRQLLVYLAALALTVGWFAVVVVDYFGGPIIAVSDPAVYAFTSFHFSKVFSAFPVPRLLLESDWIHYPYGGVHVFLHGAFERDLMVSSLREWFGPGPWMQCYFLFSLVVTALGVYLLLRPMHGFRVAAAAGLGVTFLNFYVIGKFPGHMPCACAHWTVLGIVADYRIVRLHAEHRRIPIQLIILRMGFTSASLGLDLGYYAGFSLLSQLVCWGYIALGELLATRVRFGSLRERAAAALRSGLEHCRAQPMATVAASMFFLVASWLFVPLALQVSVTASRFMTGEFNYVQWEHPLRLLIPFLPGLNPETVGVSFLGDRGENWGFDFSPGLSLVLAGAAALILGRSRYRVSLPFVFIFVLLVTFNPIRFPTLRLLPWFEFARTPGRATAVFPVLLLIFMLSADHFRPVRAWQKSLAASLVVLLAVETVTAYRLILDAKYTPSSGKVFAPDTRFWELMEVIRRTPGEALFEWPFYLSEDSRLAVFRRSVGANFQLAQFHGKKIVGAQFGRQLARGAEPFVTAGWADLMLPDSPDKQSTRQRRPLVEQEQAFFSDFIRFNDFCGILLAPDSLAPGTVDFIYREIGRPVAAAMVVPGPGRLEFVPKPATWYPDIDRDRGRRLRLVRPVFDLPVGGRLDIGERVAEDYLREGWSPERSLRRTNGNVAGLEFRTANPVDALLRMKVYAMNRSQRVVVKLNDIEAGTLDVALQEMKVYDLPLRSEWFREANSLILELPDSVASPTPRGLVYAGLRVDWIEVSPAG